MNFYSEEKGVKKYSLKLLTGSNTYIFQQF